MLSKLVVFNRQEFMFFFLKVFFSICIIINLTNKYSKAKTSI